MSRPSGPVLFAIALPLVLALAVASLAVAARLGAFTVALPVDTTPLALAPVDAPDAEGPDCSKLLGLLPADLAGSTGPLPTRGLTAPLQPGARAWAAAPQPVVLRCGLPRPDELTPSSELLVIDSVNWLKLDDGIPNADVVTYIAVDRPVYVALTTPVGEGGGPLQQVADLLRDNYPPTKVAVR
jgi:hypothetical protein